MDRSTYHGMRESATACCLGQPPHPMRDDESICSICGTLASGAQLGIYQVQQLLGQGRSGKAYLAVHLRSRQSVVVKLFPPDATTMGLWEAARREVRIITALQHPAFLPIYSCTPWSPDQDRNNSRPLNEQMLAYSGRTNYLLTLCQYAPSSLQNLVAHYERQENRVGSNPGDPGGVLLPRLLYLIRQIGEAISTLHLRDMVHGAITPGNILLASQDRLLLADSGLARLHPPAPPYQAPELHNIYTRCVQAGNMTALWKAANPASDQYMLAVLCQQIFSRLLQADDYKHLLPVLQCATNTQITKRFASIDIFLHELSVQGKQSRPFPASNYASSETGGIRQRTSQSQTQTPTPLPSGHSQPAYPARSTPTPSAPSNSARPTSPQTSLPSTETDQDWYGQMQAYNPAALSPNSEEDWEKLGGKHFTGHKYEAALKAYLRALEIDNGKSTLWLALGDTYFAMSHYAEALKTYEQALTLNPDDPTAWNNRGAALDALGRHKDAAQCYDRAEQLSPV
jgi:serine/threonine protein kinase